MSEKKRIITGCAKIISFALVFVLVLQILSLTVFSKKGATAYNGSLSKAYSFMQEPNNTIDVIAVGNSDLYSALVPAQLWTKHGYTCNVISSPHQTPQQSYHMLETMYETQSPKVVIVEVDMLYDCMVEDRSSVQSTQTLTGVICDKMNCDNFDELIKNSFSVFTFHDKWKKAGKPQKPEVPNSHGYKFSDKISKISYTNHMRETDKKEPIKKNNVNGLKSIVKLCRSHGSEVYFIEIFSCTSWDTERHNAVSELAEKMGIDFVDYNLLADEIKLKPEMSFRDEGNHLNYYAACKVSDHVGAYLSAHYDLPDRRKDAKFAYYQNSIDSFYREIKINSKSRSVI